MNDNNFSTDGIIHIDAETRLHIGLQMKSVQRVGVYIPLYTYTRV